MNYFFKEIKVAPTTHNTLAPPVAHNHVTNIDQLMPPSASNKDVASSNIL